MLRCALHDEDGVSPWAAASLDQAPLSELVGGDGEAFVDVLLGGLLPIEAEEYGVVVDAGV